MCVCVCVCVCVCTYVYVCVCVCVCVCMCVGGWVLDACAFGLLFFGGGIHLFLPSFCVFHHLADHKDNLVLQIGGRERKQTFAMLNFVV